MTAIHITILGIRLARRYIPILCGVRPLQFNRTVFKRQPSHQNNPPDTKRFGGYFCKEMRMDIYTVAFFGHRYIDNPFRIEDRLEEEIRRLLSEHEYVDFLVGRDGDFDQFASSAVLRIRKQYRDDNSSLVLVLPYARAEYLNSITASLSLSQQGG